MKSGSEVRGGRGSEVSRGSGYEVSRGRGSEASRGAGGGSHVTNLQRHGVVSTRENREYAEDIIDLQHTIYFLCLLFSSGNT